MWMWTTDHLSIYIGLFYFIFYNAYIKERRSQRDRVNYNQWSRASTNAGRDRGLVFITCMVLIANNISSLFSVPTSHNTWHCFFLWDAPKQTCLMTLMQGRSYGGARGGRPLACTHPNYPISSIIFLILFVKILIVLYP